MSTPKILHTARHDGVRLDIVEMVFDSKGEPTICAAFRTLPPGAWPKLVAAEPDQVHAAVKASTEFRSLLGRYALLPLTLDRINPADVVSKLPRDYRPGVAL